MGDPRWVCLSDVHLGAHNSVLTHVKGDRLAVHVDEPAPALYELARCLRAIAAMASRPPTLVLVGDVLELALAEENVAAMAFEQFVHLLLADGTFDQTVWFVPGNHDHHLWETARERQYVRYLRHMPPDDRIEPARHSTPLCPSDDAPLSDVLTTLLRRNDSLRDARVRVGYPNLAFVRDDGARAVVLHHGHYVEPFYRLITTLHDLAFPGREGPQVAHDIEAENFAWVDFFWSTLGRSGTAGTDVGHVYEMLRSEEAMDALVANLAAGISASRVRDRRLRPLARVALRMALRRIAARAVRLERHIPDVAMSEPAEAGLRAYVEGPVFNQLAAEIASGHVPHELTFVFGHTHKPFSKVLTARPGGHRPRPVEVHNTGGWVVDTRRTAPMQGGAVIVVDDELNTASVRMYQQGAHPWPVAVQAASEERPNPLVDALRKVVRPEEAPWSTFARTVHETVRDRHRQLARRIADAEAMAKRRHPYPKRGV